MPNKVSNRRFFLGRQLPGLLCLYWVGCRQLTPSEIADNVVEKSTKTNDGLITPGTVAHFLQDKNPTYDDQVDWEFPGGQAALLLLALGEYSIGNYHYYVNGSLIINPINRAVFEPSRQTLTIRRNGQTVYSHAPIPGRRPQYRD